MAVDVGHGYREVMGDERVLGTDERSWRSEITGALSEWCAVERSIPSATLCDCLREFWCDWYGPQLVVRRSIDAPKTPSTSAEVQVNQSILPDSGTRKEYSTGAVRDASSGKGLFHLVPPIALRAIAKRFEDGATKYGLNNWQKGIALSHYYDSITRHTLQAAEGDNTEDHFGAMLWNAACWLWTEEQIRAGKLPAELDDLTYRQKELQRASDPAN